MNKKLILAIVIVLVLIAVAVAVICLATAPGQEAQNPTDTTTQPQGAGVGVRPEQPEDPTYTTEGEPVDPTESISVTIGVGQRPENPDTQTPDTTEPGKQDPTTDTKPDDTVTGGMTWEAYLELSPAERKAYYDQFESDEAFVLWFNAAKDAYESGNMLEAGKDPIDFSTIPNP